VSDEALFFDLEPGTSEHYDDPILYDREYKRRRQDVGFYCRAAQEYFGGPGRILELGCGSGRITKALARDGHSILATDLSDAMLARARTNLSSLAAVQRDRVSLERADMRDLDLEERFPLVIAGFNTLEHLYDLDDVMRCFDRVREALAPGGMFIFDVQNPEPRNLCRDPKRRWGRTKFRHPETRERWEYSTNEVYDRERQILFIRLYYKCLDDAQGEPERVVRLAQRQFYPQELEALVALAGFETVLHLGSFEDGTESGPGESQIVFCQPRPADS
jgi:SAM-dependent methyltransferase